MKLQFDWMIGYNEQGLIKELIFGIWLIWPCGFWIEILRDFIRYIIGGFDCKKVHENRIKEYLQGLYWDFDGFIEDILENWLWIISSCSSIKYKSNYSSLLSIVYRWGMRINNCSDRGYDFKGTLSFQLSLNRLFWFQFYKAKYRDILMYVFGRKDDNYHSI